MAGVLLPAFNCGAGVDAAAVPAGVLHVTRLLFQNRHGLRLSIIFSRIVLGVELRIRVLRAGDEDPRHQRRER